MKNNYLKNYLKQKLYERVDQIPPEPPEFLERPFPENEVEAREPPFPGWFGPPGPWSQDVLDRQRDWDPENETLVEFWLISYPWLRRYLNNPEMFEYILEYLRYNGTPWWDESVQIPWHIRNNPRWPWYRYMA